MQVGTRPGGLRMEMTIIRFLVGGAVASAFSIVGGLFKPTSFAGLFGAVPSVALATLWIVAVREGKYYAGAECRSIQPG